MKPGAGERVAQLLLAFLKALCCLALFLGAQVLVVLPVSAAAILRAAVNGGTVDQQALARMLSEQSMTFALVAYTLTLFIVMAFYLIRRKRFSEALWLRRVEAPTLWTGAALAPALYLAVTAVLMVLPESWLEGYQEASTGITSGGVVGILAVVVAAPIVEEVMFRGLIMTRLSQAMPGWLAVLLSAAIFGACHGDPVWFGYTFPLGVFFGFLDLRAGSIWPSILGHMAFNAIGQTADLLPDRNVAAVLAFFLVLLVLAAVLPILDRRGIKALFRPGAKRPAVRELPAVPGVYEFDPWDA